MKIGEWKRDKEYIEEIWGVCTRVVKGENSKKDVKEKENAGRIREDDRDYIEIHKHRLHQIPLYEALKCLSG